MPLFKDLSPAPDDPIFGIGNAFRQDPRKEKVNLSVGVYKDQSFNTPIMTAVKEAEKLLLQSESTKEYLPILGDPVYLKSLGKLVFGEAMYAEKHELIGACQSVGGTGALRLGCEILKVLDFTHIFLPKPTWPIHNALTREVFSQVSEYPYYDYENNKVDISSFKQYLKNVPSKSVILMHAACHNPSGADPSEAEWKEISDIMLERNLLPFFDFAYMGLGASLEEDAKAVRYFADQGHEMLIAYSCSKNFGLYAERIGALFILCRSQQKKDNILSHLRWKVRGIYSNPPMHGAAIVKTILNDKELYNLWENELFQMRARIEKTRAELADALDQATNTTQFSHLKRAKGLFAFLGIDSSLTEKLTKEYAIYMTKDGRINVAGLNLSNLPYVVKAITEVIK